VPAAGRHRCQGRRHPATGWKVTSSSLALDGKALSGTTLDGSTPTAGSSHTLTGTVAFAKGGTHLR